MTAHLGLPYFLFFREQYFHFILEVLTTEKRAHAGPILPFTMEKLDLTLPSAHAGPIFIFPWTVLPFYFGSTNHRKTRLARASAHAGPILPFFPWIVLPFCYFSVVRKVTEKPVLFSKIYSKIWPKLVFLGVVTHD